MARGEDLPGFGFLQQPLERAIAAAPEVGGVSDPVMVHVEADRGRRRELRQPAGLASDLDEVHPRPTELFRQGQVQVAGGAQLVEVFLEESIVTVIDRRALAAPLEERIGQNGR
jgi:hypothetical protein